MTTDARRLMRLGAVASMEHSVVRLLVGTAKLPDLGSPRAGQRAYNRVGRLGWMLGQRRPEGKKGFPALCRSQPAG